jgi:hypothetical protein
MAIQYAGGTIVNTLTTVTSKATLFAAIDSALTGAGWTITTVNSSVDKIYQCAATPQSNQIKVRVFDPGGGTTSICLRMLNVGQTLSQSVGCFLFPSTSANYRIIADQYQFLIFVPGSVSSRNFCMASAIYLPPNMVTYGVTTAAFIMGDGQSDTDTSNTVGSFRTSLNSRGLVGYAPSQGWSILNSTAVEYNAVAADGSAHTGFPSLVCFQSTAMEAITGYRWVDNSALIVEPMICWGTPGYNNEGKLVGQLWDSFIATESYPADATALVDSHTYYSITSNNGGNTTLPESMRGTLFVVSA